MKNFLTIVAAGPAAFALSFSFTWLSLGPWRRAKSEHWTEQARVLWPAIIAARSHHWVIPSIFVLSCLQFLPETNAASLLAVGFFATLGSFISLVPINRELFPRISLASLVRQTAVGFLIGMLHLFVVIGAAISMPSHANWKMFGITVAIVGFQLFWANGGWIWISRQIGTVVSPPERLKQIAEQAAKNAGIGFKKIWLLRMEISQALAQPNTGELLFTSRILELLNDNELAAICAHELGHLTESQSVRILRTLNSLTLIPWVFINPLMAAFGVAGFCLPVISTLVLPRVFNPISQRLENRADKIAASQQANVGDYANALLKIHIDNRTPAVFQNNKLTHPSLYDRMLAAGITPDFPRPKAPGTMSWTGLVLSIVLGLLFATSVLSRYH